MTPVGQLSDGNGWVSHLPLQSLSGASESAYHDELLGRKSGTMCFYPYRLFLSFHNSSFGPSDGLKPESAVRTYHCNPGVSNLGLDLSFNTGLDIKRADCFGTPNTQAISGLFRNPLPSMSLSSI